MASSTKKGLAPRDAWLLQMEAGHVVSVSGSATLLTEAVSWTLEQAEVVPTLEVRHPPPGF